MAPLSYRSRTFFFASLMFSGLRSLCKIVVVSLLLSSFEVDFSVGIEGKFENKQLIYVPSSEIRGYIHRQQLVIYASFAIY